MPAAKKNSKTAVKKKTISKSTTKKTVVKKTSAKKAVPKKKTVTKATTKRKTTTKRKPVAKKKLVSKSTTKKTVVKKTSAKKAVPKKKTATKATTTAKKKTTSKTAPKKTVAKKTSNKKAAPKKTTIKKKPVSKSVAKKKVLSKATPKSSTIKYSWKDNSLLSYAFNFILVSILTIVVRMASALALSQYMGLNWSINYKLKYLPVLAFSERNVIMFEKMNTFSLVITTLVISALFIMTLYRSVKTKQEYDRYVVRANAWFIGIFVSIITFIASLFMSESIHYATNILGLIPILAILVISCILYFLRMDKVDKRFQ